MFGDISMEVITFNYKKNSFLNNLKGENVVAEPGVYPKFNLDGSMYIDFMNRGKIRFVQI